MQVDTLTPILEVIPGQPVIGRIRVLNDTARDTSYRIRVVGIDAPTEWRPIAGGAVPSGTEVHVEVPILVPDLLGLGDHPVGVEVTSDQASERPGLASMTVSVESVADVVLRAEPAIVRGSTRGKFRLDIENREPTPVELQLVGGAADITAKFKPDRVLLQPGQRGVSKGKLKGRRRWSGDHEQHFVTLTARGRASSTSITTRFVQRSMFPWRFRTLVVALIVFALWIAGALAYVWYQRDKANDESRREEARLEQIANADADSDGIPDGSADQGSGGSGDGSGGSGGGSADAAADEKEKFPTETTFGGAVTLADGSDPAEVRVSLDQIPLGQALEGASPATFIGGPESAKIWSARYGSAERAGISGLRQTETVRSVDTTTDGTWRIPNVALRRSYEVVFSRAGYNTQSFVVTPPEDGAPVELEVELQAADGVIAGVVRDSSGGLGGVSLVATDGDLTFATTTSTDPGTLGQFSFNGLTTPAVYSVTASRAGFGTEVVQFELAAGQPRTGEVISMRAGVGSITGTVLARQSDIGGGTTEQPFGGVTLTVTNGELERTVTSLTEGATGTFSIPRLPIPGIYTVTASADGFADASLTVELSGARSDVLLRLVNEFAVLRGLVVGDDGSPVPGAGITLTRDDLSFSSNTVSDDTRDLIASSGQFLLSDGLARLREMTSFGAAPGEFRISDLPPGEYRVEIVHFAHEPYSSTVVLEAGDDQFLSIELVSRTAIPGATNSLSVFATENGDRELEGVEFWLRRPGAVHDPTVPGLIPPVGNKIVEFTDLDLGTYVLRAELENYRTNEILVSVGEGAQAPKEISLRPFGNVVVRIVDSITGEELADYDLKVVEVRTDGLVPDEIGGEINDDPDDVALNGIVWATGITEELNDGIWRVEMRNHPDGYRVLDQDIIFEPPIVDNVSEPLQFQVTRDSRPTIEIKLKANAFPNLKVRTYAPPPSTTGPQEVGILGVGGLTTRLECGPTLGYTAIADTTNSGVPTGVYDIDAVENDFSPDLLTSDACQIVVTGDGYEPAVAPLDGRLQLANDAITFDRQISVVMVPRAVTVTGRVSWFDGNGDVFLPDTPIRSIAEVITGYEPTQTIGPATPDKPIPTPDFIEAVWADDPDNPGVASERFFTIAGQVFDPGVYTITYPDTVTQRIRPGTVTLTIPVVPGASALTAEPATTALSSQTQPAPATFDYDPITNTYDYNVKLLQPDDGVLQGCLTLRTIRNAPNFDEVIDLIRATPVPSVTSVGVTASNTVPGCPEDDSTNSLAPQTQGFELVASAGAWNVEYVLPPGDWYQYDPNVPAPVENRVEPGLPRNGFDHTLVENATIDLTIERGTASTGPQPLLDTTYTVIPYAGYTGPVPAPVDIDDAEFAKIRGVPVDADNPFVKVKDFLLLDVPGYDVDGASVVAGGVSLTGAASIPIELSAGEEAGITVNIDPLGQISGSIKGYIWRLPTDRQPVTGFNQLTGIDVQARRVAYDAITKVRLSPDVEADWFDLPPPTDSLIPNVGTDSIDFSLSNVPPGSYEFRVLATSNPVEIAYKLGPVSPSGAQLLDVEFPPAAAGDGDLLTDGTRVYAMRNTETIAIPGPLALVLEPSTLDLRMWDTYDHATDSGVELAGAQMQVFRISDGAPILPNGLPTTVGADPATTLWTLPNAATTIRLQPDTYRFEIFNRVAGIDESYPSTIVLTLPTGPTLAERTLRVDVTLPPLDYQLAVHVKVVNEDWTAADLVTADNTMNRLPVPDGVVVTRNWDAPNPFVTDDSGSTQTSNLAVLGVPQTLKTCAFGDPDPTCSTAPPGYERTLLFDGIPTGTHEITITAPLGYELVVRPPATVVGNPTDLDYPVTLAIDVDDVTDQFDLVLRVKDVQVDVDITNADQHEFPGRYAAVYYEGVLVEDTITDMDSDIDVIRSSIDPELTRITGLPPRRDPYELRLDDELHAPNWNDGITAPPLSAPVTFTAAVDLDDDPLTYQQLDTTVVADVARLAATLRLENVPDGCSIPPGVINADCGKLPTTPADLFKVAGFAQPHADGVATLDFNRSFAETLQVEVNNGQPYTSYDQNVPIPRGHITTLNVELLKLAEINLEVTGAAVGDITVTPVVVPIAEANNLIRIDPPNDTFANRWKFYLSPGTTSIAFDVEAPGLFPVTTETILNATGLAPPPIIVDLASRSVTVNLTTSNGQDFEPRVEFQLPIADPFVRTDLYQATAPQSSPFSVAFPQTGPALPDTGQARVKVSAPGYRDNEGETSGAIEADMDIDVTLRPLVTVSGTLSFVGTTIPVDHTLITATKSGGPTHTAIVSPDGTYVFNGGPLDDSNATTADPLFDVGTWQVTASVIGWGRGVSSTFTIDETMVNQTVADSYTVPVIALVPRQIDATLTVTRPGSTTALQSWEYAVPPSTDAAPPASGGVVTLMESGTLDPLVYIRETNSLWTKFGVDLRTVTVHGTQVAVSDTLALFQAPIVRGLVIDTDANPDKAGSANKVYIIADCNKSVSRVPKADDEGDGLFLFASTYFDRADLVFDSIAGSTSYCVYVDGGGGKIARLPITISTSGTTLSVTENTPIELIDLRVEFGALGTPPMTVTTSAAQFATGGDLDGSGDFSLNDTLEWTVTVTNNSGTIPLTRVEAKSNNPAGGGDLKTPCNDVPLEHGASCTLTVTYQVRQADVDRGSITIDGVGKSEQTGDVDAASIVTTIETAAVSVTSLSPTPATAVTGNVTFTYLVTNTGTGTLTGLSVAATNVNPAPTCTGFATGGRLLTGNTATCTATHTVTQAELNAGTPLTSRLTVTTTQKTFPQTSALTMYSITQTKSVFVQASVNSTSIAAPGPLVYTITVKNTGNVDLTSVSLSKTRGTTPTTSDSGVLSPDETWTFTSSYPVTQADINSGSSLVNNFGVNATPSVSETGTLSATTTITQTPLVAVTASVDETSISSSVPLTYTVAIENTGNVDLTSVSLTATYGTPIRTSGGGTTLNVNETWTYEWTYTPTSGTSGTPVVNSFGLTATPSPTATGDLSASTSVTATFP